MATRVHKLVGPAIAWRNLCMRGLDIIERRNVITSSQISLLMGDIHKVLLVGDFVEYTHLEKKLQKKAKHMLKLLEPIHYQACNGNLSSVTEKEWNNLEAFLQDSTL